MTEQQATGEGTSITLQERVKLLKVVIDKRRYKAGRDIQWKVTLFYYYSGSLTHHTSTALNGTWVDGKRCSLYLKHR